MNGPYTPPPEFRMLLDRLLDSGTLSRVETSRLEEWLQQPEARHHYVRLVMQESMMDPLLARAAETIPGDPRQTPRPVLASPLWKVAAAIALLAAGVMLGRTAFPSPETAIADNSPPLAAAEAPARITGMIGVHWSVTGVDPRQPGSWPLPEHRLVFETGLIELSYRSGVRVTLEGPADFTITGNGNGRLEYGKLVTYVPKGAEGFIIDYPHGHVLDLGTEFAMDLPRGGALKLGVFDGEVKLCLPDDPPRPLLRDQAILHDHIAEVPLRAIPFERDQFVRNLPSRDFPWTMNSEDPRELSFDVTHLIWRPARYHAIFKWIDGVDAIEVRDVELRRDGVTVASAPGDAVCGLLLLTRDNRFIFDLSPDDFWHSARWTVHARVSAHPRYAALARSGAPIHSQGILQFEEGLAGTAIDRDFIGRWVYLHAGERFVREFHSDGTISLEKNGVPMPRAFEGCHWLVRDGVLHATQPSGGPDELHVLRDVRTLVFLNRPYHNARREHSEELGRR